MNTAGHCMKTVWKTDALRKTSATVGTFLVSFLRNMYLRYTQHIWLQMLVCHYFFSHHTFFFLSWNTEI